MNKVEELFRKLGLFKHKTNGKVRFAEVDTYGVVHNINYFFWLEAARTDYFSDLLTHLDPKTFLNDVPFMVVHAEIDYFNPAKFNDIYHVYTRVSSIKNSSLTFENIITLESGIPLVYSSAVLVQLDVKENKSQRISDDIRLLIKNYEGDNINFLD
jgi:acyl-CoA thioester hydrolase